MPVTQGKGVGHAVHDETTLDVLGTMRQAADWFALILAAGSNSVRTCSEVEFGDEGK